MTTQWAWGTVHCRRCDRSSVIVVEEVDGVSRLGGIECKKCGAFRARFIHRGGVCATEAAAVARAERWIDDALTEHEPPPSHRR